MFPIFNQYSISCATYSRITLLYECLREAERNEQYEVAAILLKEINEIKEQLKVPK